MTWSYHPDGWAKVFAPISDTCTDPSGSDRFYLLGSIRKDEISWWAVCYWQWNLLPCVCVYEGMNEDERYVDTAIPTANQSRRSVFPFMAIPRDLFGRMVRFHGNPQAWWTGQFMKYLLRYQPETSEMLQQTEQSMNFTHPIVGYSFNSIQFNSIRIPNRIFDVVCTLGDPIKSDRPIRIIKKRHIIRLTNTCSKSNPISIKSKWKAK